LLLPYFLLANYTFNKTFSLEGKEAQNGGGKFSKIGGTSAQNWREAGPDFDSKFGGDRSHWWS